MFADYETQSAVDLKRCGSYKYVSDKSTRILSMACMDSDTQKFFYVPDYQRIELPKHIDGIPIYRSLNIRWDQHDWAAHNAVGFESLVTKRFFNREPQWLDTIHLCRQNGLPGSLEKVAQSLGIGLKLDGLKSVLMMQPKNGKYPMGTIPLWLSILRYNMTDVILTKAITEKFPKLHEPEVCNVDAKINHRGVYIDTDFTKTLIGLYHRHEEEQKRICQKEYGLNGDDLWSVPKVKDWLKRQCGVSLDGLNQNEVKEFMESPYEFAGESDNERIQRAVALLEIRRSVVRVGSAKLLRLLDMVVDSRFRGGCVYHAAHTGRWGGYGAQPHNLPCPPKGINYEYLCHNLTYEKVKAESERLKVTIADVLSALIRPCFRAAPGKKLAVADYDKVEARMIAWLSNDKGFMDLLNSGADPYVEFGKKVGGNRQMGKIGILACGYGMGKHRCSQQFGIPIEQAALIVNTFRTSFPAVPKFWQDLHKAGLEVMERGRASVGRIVFVVEGDCVFVSLPSGRRLCYRNPVIRNKVAGWRKLYNAPPIEEPTFCYWNPKGYEVDMYGGKWAENICQAACRDLLADLLVQCESDLPAVLHVHDEVLCESEQDGLNELTSRMGQGAEWASGLQVRGNGYTSEYYYKE